MKERYFLKDSVIFNEGSTEDWMFDILSGSVGIYKNYGKADQELLTTLKAGDCFGEMGMVEELPRSATAVALEMSQVAMVTAEDFAAYFQDKPAKVMSILQHTSRRMRTLTVDYLEACKAVADYVQAEENGEKQSEDLVNKMKKIVNFGKKY